MIDELRKAWAKHPDLAYMRELGILAGYKVQRRDVEIAATIPVSVDQRPVPQSEFAWNTLVTPSYQRSRDRFAQVRAGLRAKEIALTTWSMVLNQMLGETLELHDKASTGRNGGRRILL